LAYLFKKGLRENAGIAQAKALSAAYAHAFPKTPRGLRLQVPSGFR